MNYKKLCISACLVLGLNSCVGVTPNGIGYDVRIPLNIINATLGQSFPQNKQTNYGTLLIDKPNILGRAGTNKLGVGTSFTFSNMLMPNGVKGAVSFSSGVRYDARDRGLYLTSPMIDELTFQNFSLSKYLTPQMRNVIGNIIAEQLMTKPIYHINRTGASFVKGIGVADGNVVVSLGL